MISETTPTDCVILTAKNWAEHREAVNAAIMYHREDHPLDALEKSDLYTFCVVDAEGLLVPKCPGASRT